MRFEGGIILVRRRVQRKDCRRKAERKTKALCISSSSQCINAGYQKLGLHCHYSPMEKSPNKFVGQACGTKPPTPKRRTQKIIKSKTKSRRGRGAASNHMLFGKAVGPRKATPQKWQTTWQTIWCQFIGRGTKTVATESNVETWRDEWGKAQKRTNRYQRLLNARSDMMNERAVHGTWHPNLMNAGWTRNANVPSRCPKIWLSPIRAL